MAGTLDLRDEVGREEWQEWFIFAVWDEEYVKATISKWDDTPGGETALLKWELVKIHLLYIYVEQEFVRYAAQILGWDPTIIFFDDNERAKTRPTSCKWAHVRPIFRRYEGMPYAEEAKLLN